MKRISEDTICYAVLFCFMLLFSVIGVYAQDDEKILLGQRFGAIEYPFNNGWNEEYQQLLDNDNGSVHKIYFFEDDIYTDGTIFYLDNPDRGYFMIPLYFSDKEDRRLFEKHFKLYTTAETDYDYESFDIMVNGENDCCPQWGFYKHVNGYFCLLHLVYVQK